MSLAAPRRRLTLAIAGVMFMLVLDGAILNTSLPAIAASQGVEPLSLSAVVTAYLMAAAAVLPFSAWLGDRFGIRRVFLTGVALFTLASLLCGLAQSPLQLILARVLQGAGGGLMQPTGRTLALRGAERHEVMDINALLVWPALFGPVLGPPLGGLLSTYASWRWNFLINIPIGLAALGLLSRWIPRDAGGGSRPLDGLGLAAATLGLTLFIGGVEWGSHGVGGAGVPVEALLCTGVGLAGLLWTVRHLRRAKFPLVSLAPFEHKTFAVSTLGGTLAAMAIQSTPFLLPLMFQLALGRGAVAAGALLLPYFAANLGMKTITSPLLRRFGFKPTLVTAGAISALSIAGFALVDGDTPWALLVAQLLVAGASRSMLMTAITTLGVADMPTEKLGASSTLSAISSLVAGALGVAVAALTLAAAAQVGGRAQPSVGDFHVAFVVVALFNAIAVWRFARLAPQSGAEILRARGA